MMDYVTFRTRRLEGEIPQGSVSKRSGVDRSRLSLFECGYVGLRDEELAAVEKALRDLIAERAQHLIGVLSSCESEPGRVVEERSKPRRAAMAG